MQLISRTAYSSLLYRKNYMEKILLALDANNLNTNTIDFACYISRLTRSRLTGVFLEDVVNGDRPVMRSLQGAAYVEKGAVNNPAPGMPKKDLTEENIATFRTACECREVQSLIHRDRGVPATEVIGESRFADLIIVDPETSFTKSNEPLPGRFIKDVLLESECPVIISPYSFDSIETIIFTYNGTKSSVFAIKQFGYLFPELRQKKAILVSVKENGDNAIEEQYKMKEWLKTHYREVELVVLNGDPSNELFGYLIEKKNAIVIMGAYGRGMLSRFFKPSHARLIVKTINLPIFISHF
jgi:nucleotide-binding universal stress UspA family protein